jgi:uncharacterized protein DUF3551
MRIATLATLIIATLALAGAVEAQTYNPHYPVCMEVYSPFVYHDCRFDSIPQCKASASGRGAQCVVNPYFAGEDPPVRRGRRAY